MLRRVFQMSQSRAIAEQCSLNRSLEQRMTEHCYLAHQLMNTFSDAYCWHLLFDDHRLEYLFQLLHPR